MDFSFSVEVIVVQLQCTMDQREEMQKDYEAAKENSNRRDQFGYEQIETRGSRLRRDQGTTC